MHIHEADSPISPGTETAMHEDLNLCYENWTTPLAAAELVEIFRKKPLFPKVYKDFIFQTMIECQTGQDRLVAPLLDKKVTVGHKTGVYGKGFDATFAEVLHLVLHQGDERSNDNANPFLGESRHLKGDGLTASRRHEPQCIFAFADTGDDLLLQVAEGVISPILF